MNFRPLFLLLLLTCCSCVYGQADTTSAGKNDSLPRIRRSALSVSIGGPLAGGIQYDCRFSFQKIKWLSADLNLGFGGSDYGTGFYWGGSALFFPKRLKLNAGGGLAFAQTGEWGYWLTGVRYETKKWFMTGLSYRGIIDNDPKHTGGGLQFLLGWRF